MAPVLYVIPKYCLKKKKKKKKKMCDRVSLGTFDFTSPPSWPSLGSFNGVVRCCGESGQCHEQERHFNFFLGAKFSNFSMPPGYWQIWKKQHFICSNLMLFIVPFCLFSLFFSFFSFFFVFLGAWRHPNPPQMMPLVTKFNLNVFMIWKHSTNMAAIQDIRVIK